MALTKAQTTRALGISEIITKYDRGAYGEDRELIAVRIEEIRWWGRTDRWNEVITTWASLVRDEDNPLRWAVLQGGIWATHANV